MERNEVETVGKVNPSSQEQQEEGLQTKQSPRSEAITISSCSHRILGQGISK